MSGMKFTIHINTLLFIVVYEHPMPSTHGQTMDNRHFGFGPGQASPTRLDCVCLGSLSVRPGAGGSESVD